MFISRRASSVKLVAVLMAALFALVSATVSPIAAGAADKPEPPKPDRLAEPVDRTSRNDDNPAGPIRRHNAENNTTMLLGRPHLTASTSSNPAKAAVAYITSNIADFGGNKGTARTLTVTSTTASPSGAQFVTIGQRIGGHPVLNAGVTVTLDAEGRVVAAGGRFVQAGPTLRARAIAPQQAIRAAAAAAKIAPQVPRVLTRADAANKALARKELFVNTFADVLDPNPITAELAWLPSTDGTSAELVWETDFEVDGDIWLRSLVSADTGEVLDQDNRYHHTDPQGTVFTGQHPDDSPARAVTPFSGLDGSWVDDRTTDGNNVIAYRDLDNDNTVGYQPQTPDNADPDYQHFDYGWTNAWNAAADESNASLDADIDAVVTQLFYYTNVMHDWAYGFGFDEASRNFQDDNFGRGGEESDRVRAEAQDGWNFGCADGDDADTDPDRCVNNARFGTPADGLNPRMQMYMFTDPHLDSSMDGDVIAHEYGHGISSRLVGDGDSDGLNYGGHLVHGSLGEGWSDVISFLKWDDPVIGEYVTGNAATGVRSVAYDSSGRMYSSYNPNLVWGHANGEIWASAIWDIRAVLGLNTTAQLVFDGLKATPGSPTFQDARDAIIGSDLANGGTNFCFLWSVFAARGIGLNSTFSFASTSSPSDDFAVADGCDPDADAGGPYSTDEGIDVAVDGSASTPGGDPSAGALTDWEWDFDNDGDFDDATGPTPTFDLVGQDGVYTIGLRVTDAFGRTATDTTTVTVDNVAPSVAVNPIAGIDEGGTASVSGTITDPGWLDVLTVTVDWGTGDGAQPVAGLLENIRPDATLTFSDSHPYGDNGLYTVTVCGLDDDTSTCVNTNVTVDNVDPTADIDEDLYLAHAGETLTVTGTSSDPGSDDLTATWIWGDGGADTVDDRLVNPPALDPPLSPSIQPRNVAWTADHIYAEACLYDLTLDVVDDDGGAGIDSAVVIITGNEDQVRGLGWWKNQYRPKPPNPSDRGTSAVLPGHCQPPVRGVRRDQRSAGDS